VWLAFRKPFVPPTPDTPVIVRSISYGGEEHPATVKRVIVAPVAHLPLKDDTARHSLKLIAGSRWTPVPPRDSGVGRDEPGEQHGYIKISCEDFPRPAMNLKWASDALDRLVEEANVCLRLSFFLKGF
jgi:small subunit ribosomal protein S35